MDAERKKLKKNRPTQAENPEERKPAQAHSTPLTNEEAVPSPPEHTQTELDTWDMPQEVIDILLKTHPLKGQEGIADTPPTVTTVQMTEKQRPSGSFGKTDRTSHKKNADKPIHHPRHTEPAPTPPSHAEESSPTNPALPNQAQHATRQKAVYEPMDLDQKKKEENLQCICDMRYEPEESIFSWQGHKKKLLIGGTVALVAVLFLIFRTFTLSIQLEQAMARITELTDISTKYETLQMDKLALEEELHTLKGDAPAQASDPTSDPASASAQGNLQETNEYSIYVAKDGDTIWDISKHFYGNGAHYQKILTANNLLESDPVHAGMQLKIPKQ